MRVRKKTVEISKKYPKKKNTFMKKRRVVSVKLCEKKTELKKKCSITFNKFSLTTIDIWNALLVLITQ